MNDRFSRNRGYTGTHRPPCSPRDGLRGPDEGRPTEHHANRYARWASHGVLLSQVASAHGGGHVVRVSQMTSQPERPNFRHHHIITVHNHLEPAEPSCQRTIAGFWASVAHNAELAWRAWSRHQRVLMIQRRCTPMQPAMRRAAHRQHPRSGPTTQRFSSACGRATKPLRTCRQSLTPSDEKLTCTTCRRMP